MYGSGSWMHGSGIFGPDMIGGGMLMILIWLIPLALLVAFIMFLTRPTGTAQRSALDILKERYARGEIGKDEFEQKKRDIGA
jgi:putative membrane protein